jgi:hypothetical protein
VRGRPVGECARPSLTRAPHPHPPNPNPAGEVWADERARNARWGESCVSYYALEVEYLLSSASAQLMALLARDFMWTRMLSATPTLDQEARDRLPERLHRIGEKVDAFEGSAAMMALGRGGGGVAGGGGGAGGGADVYSSSALNRASAYGAANLKSSDLAEAAVAAAELAGEAVRATAGQVVKLAVFENVAPTAGAAAGGGQARPGPAGLATSSLAKLSVALDSAARMG